MATDLHQMIQAGSPRLASSTALSRGAVLPWLIPLIIVAGLGGWIYTTSLHPPSPSATPAAPRVTLDIPATDPLPRLTMLMNHAAQSLGGVSDESSARDAVPQLEAVTAELDSVSLDEIKDLDRAVARNMLDGFPDMIAPLMTEINAMPGAGPILGPAVKSLRARVAVAARRVK